MNFETQWVHLDETGLRKRLETERKKLLNTLSDNDDTNAVTQGRVSGVYLALSFLDEFVVREKERDTM